MMSYKVCANCEHFKDISEHDIYHLARRVKK